jgi:hypothetical protein
MEVIFQLRISSEKEDANNRSGAMHIIHLERVDFFYIAYRRNKKKYFTKKKQQQTDT